MHDSPPGSSVHGILQARILEWVAFPFSRDLPDPGIEPRSPTLQADSSLSEPPGKQDSNSTYLQRDAVSLNEFNVCRIVPDTGSAQKY